MYPNTEETKDEQVSIQLINFLKDLDIELFTDQFGEPHVLLKENPYPLPIDSSDFRKWVTKISYQKLGRTFNDQIVAQAKRVLEVEAIETKDVRKIHIRIAKHGDSIYYDLGEGIVKIGKEGWNINSDAPVYFRKYKGQKIHTPPMNGTEENLSQFMDLVNIKSEEEKLLFKVFLLSCFIPGFPHPLLVVHGQQGSAKSTLFRMIKDLTDPWEMKTFPPIRDQNQFIQIMSHHSVALFDNLSGLSANLSDEIARVITGYGGSKRKHYTNDDDFIYQFQSIVGINGINNVVTKSDLLDRSILIQLSRIKNNKRKTEKELNQKFEDIKASLLGYCFDVISKTLAIEPEIKLDSHDRMADFIHWGVAITTAMRLNPDTFLQAFDNNIKRRDEEAIEASPLALTLEHYLSHSGENSIGGTPTNVFKKLSIYAAQKLQIETNQNNYWPKNAQWLLRKLNEIAPNLEARGIEISHGRTSEGRFIYLAKNEKSKGNSDTNDNKQQNSDICDTSP